jgi:hypothetical protein
VWKQLVGDEVTVADVAAIDLLSFRVVDEIRGLLRNKKMSSDAFDSVMSDRKFEVYGSDAKVYPLIPNGSNISITRSNAEQFCEAFTAYRINEFSVQCAAIRKGMATVLPSAMIQLFSWQEMERLVRGVLWSHGLEGCSVNDFLFVVWAE